MDSANILIQTNFQSNAEFKKLQVEKHNMMLFVNQRLKAYKIILYVVN